MKKLLWLLLVCILSGLASAWATQAAPATRRIPVTCGAVLGQNALPIFNEDGTYLCGEVAAPNRTAL